jgi:stress response protein YsnF
MARACRLDLKPLVQQVSVRLTDTVWEMREDEGRRWLSAGTPSARRRPSGTARAENAMTRSEERLNVDSQTHEAGRARLRKYVATEQMQQTLPVSHE